MKDYVTYVPAVVRDRLRSVSEELKTGGINGAVELVLRAFRGDLIGEVARAFPAILDFDEEWIRLPLTIDDESKAEIEAVSSHLPIRRMYVAGALLVAHRGHLPELIARGRQRTPTSGEGDQDVAVALAGAS